MLESVQNNLLPFISTILCHQFFERFYEMKFKFHTHKLTHSPHDNVLNFIDFTPFNGRLVLLPRMARNIVFNLF